MRLNIKMKFVLVALVISVLSIYIISMYMNAQFTKWYSEQTAHSNQQILRQLSYNLNLYLDEIYRLTLMPYYNDNIMNELKTEPKTLLGMQQKRRIIEDFLIGAMVFPRQDIQRVSITSDALYFSDQVGIPLPTYAQVHNSQWYQEVMQNEIPLIILPGDSSRYFSIANVIRDLIYNSRILGVIKVDANYSTIRQLCENVDMGSSGGVIILAENDQVVYSSLTPEQALIVLEDIKTGNTEKVDTNLINFRGYLYNTVILSRFGWRVITVNSLDAVKKIYIHTQRLTLLVLFIGILCSSILMYLLMNHFFKPFYAIIKLMKTVEAGDFTLRYHGTQTDEIGYLGTTLNTMLDRIDAMFKENAELDKRIYRAQLFQRETQIQLLYSQIRPHFIYNTLNMISILIQQNQPDLAVDNINKLSLLLQGIAYINKEIPISTELRLVESYLAIHQLRSGNRLSYSVEVEQELQNYILPALILQPLVENAVIHSGEGGQRHTHIRIFSEINAGTFCICIEDNGSGIPVDKLEKINRKMLRTYPREDTPFRDLSGIGGIGLVNVNTRIRMRFGEDYGLKIDSQFGFGTVVRVLFPLQWKEAESIDADIDC
jgi:two-component system sensor histidine kinase YesM